MFNLYKGGKLVAKVQGENAHMAAGALVAACYADVVKSCYGVVLSEKEARLASDPCPVYYASLIRHNHNAKVDKKLAELAARHPSLAR